jgi:hypothetical protein
MDSVEKLTTLGTQDTIRRQTNIYEQYIYVEKKSKKNHFYLNEYLTDKDQQPLFAASYTNFLHFPFKKQGILH